MTHCCPVNILKLFRKSCEFAYVPLWRGLGGGRTANSFFIVTFFVIATKKVTKEKSRQTRSLRAFCLARTTLFGG
ncbi:MAG: hypothetical protein ACK5BV_00685, partial [Bacteroidota bacterium]